VTLSMATPWLLFPSDGLPSPYSVAHYSYIDPGTGGKITALIAASDRILSLADNDTKIVPGHGPLGNKTDLTKSP
jgi:hypothetical protein